MDQKSTLRASIKAARRASTSRTDPHADPRSAAAAAFATQLAALVEETGAKRVSCFVSAHGEPDTSGFFAWALEHGIEVLLPRVVSDTEMEWARLTRDPFVPGRFGIPEPAGDAVPQSDLASLDLMFIPAAAVDHSGTRLGWGRGYFDRELAAIHSAHAAANTSASTAPPELFAVVFEREIYDALPSEPHDIPVTGAVSEARTHRFG